MITWLVALSFFGPAVPNPEGIEFFENKIRPVLVRHCYECHSAEAKKRRGSLLLDTRAGIRQGGELGPAVVPSNLDESLLIDAIRYKSLEMPPNGKLPDSVIADFERWIQIGAPDPRQGDLPPISKKVDLEPNRHFWSFQPLAIMPLPPTSQPAWSQRRIDRFIHAEHDRHALSPSPRAARRTLVRRAYFDLIGLPPTVDAVRRFIDDPRPDAYARLVDQLLASPHHGQRWGRHWLDVSRYGDDHSNTSVAPTFTSAYRYRDWVVAAINADVPYDQFVIRQIATDKLPTTGPEDLPALGFIGAGPQYHKELRLAKAVIEKLVADEWDERVDTLTRGLLGLTVACARCHDHKFDPITQEDYYALAGVMASTRLVDLPIIRGTDLEIAQRANELIKSHQEQIRAIELAGAAATQSTTHEPYVASRAIDGVFNNYMQTQAFPGEERIAWWKLDLVQPTKIARIIVYNRGDDARTTSRLRDIRVTILDENEKVLWTSDLLNPENELGHGIFDKGPEKFVVDLLQEHGGPIDGRWIRVERTPDSDLSGTAGTGLAEDQSSLNFGELEVFEVTSDAEVKQRLLLEKPLSADSVTQIEKFNADIQTLRDNTPYVDIPMAHAVEDASLYVEPVNDALHEFVYRRGQARDLPIYLRGDPATPGPIVARRFLAVLSSEPPRPFEGGSGRLALAQAIFHEGQSLAARVAVNRAWLQHFGHGLVNTPGNFGVSGAPPSHPQLLTDLAARFVQSGWSAKWLHREIMLSASYQQAGTSDDTKYKQDSTNRWLWRMSRRRLSVEAWRDAILTAAGTLDRTIGGPSIDLDSTHNVRQTIYGNVSRIKLNHLLGLYDFPDPSQHGPLRELTTTPLQQLFVLNSSFIMRQSAALAHRSNHGAQFSTTQKIRRLYELTLSRQPNAKELKLAQHFLQNRQLEGGSGMEPWNQFAQVLLSTNELMFVD